MPLGTKLTTADIGNLAAKIEKQRQMFETQISNLRADCVREPGFEGSAANKYDEWMDRWQQGAADMDAALMGASQMLQSFHDQLEELNLSVADGFNLA